MWILQLFLILCLLGFYADSMLVKSWGTGLKINQLRWSVNDIFNEALQLMTLGQKGVYPVKGFTKIINSTADNLVYFEAYNGWIEDLQLESVNTPTTELRRVVMTRAERYLHEKAAGIKDKIKENADQERHQHEMIICLECMALSITKLHYAYRTEMNSTEDSTKTEPILLWTAGTLDGQYSITMPITFQMSIMVSHIHNNLNNEEIRDNNTRNTTKDSKKQCIILLEPLQLTTWHKRWQVMATKVGRFSFLSEHVDNWLEKHFNNSTLQDLRTTLDNSVRKVLHTRNICLEILLKDSDYSHD